MKEWILLFNLISYIPCESPIHVNLYNLPLEFWFVRVLESIDSSLDWTLEVDMGSDDSAQATRIYVLAIYQILKSICLLHLNFFTWTPNKFSSILAIIASMVLIFSFGSVGSNGPGVGG